MAFDFEGEQAAYNSAWMYVQELSFLRRYLHLTRVAKDWNNYYEWLRSYYAALYARMEEKGKAKLMEKHKEIYQIVKQKYFDFLTLKKHQAKEIPNDIFEHFYGWELELRLDENRLGLLVPNRSDPAFALSGANY